MEVVLVRHRRKENRFGPSPANNYTSGYGRKGGFFGRFRRNKEPDPYTLLPAQSGVGRLIHQSRVPVYPLFINGLINDLPRQVESNFDGSGQDIHVVFGKPIDFGTLLDEPPSAKVEQRIADLTLEVIGQLGQHSSIQQIRQCRQILSLIGQIAHQSGRSTLRGVAPDVALNQLHHKLNLPLHLPVFMESTKLTA